ncbi:MAG: methyltransferase domain-containing protein [Planctomycetota bacterium]
MIGKLRAKLRLEVERLWSIRVHGGAWAALRVIYVEGLRNSALRAAASIPFLPQSNRVRCNICGWSSASFLSHCGIDYESTNAFCGRCRSYARHRGFAWLLEQGQISGGGGALLFAPEHALRIALTQAGFAPIGTDLAPKNSLVRVRQDAQFLGLRDRSLALAVSFHVLEHVPDDRRALRELARVLAPDGQLVLCVPITQHHAATREFGAPDPRLNDHYRDYGRDFGERLEGAGFDYREFRLDHVIPAAEHVRLAMIDESIFLARPRAALSPESPPTLHR